MGIDTISETDNKQIDSRFLEPTCGMRHFLAEILRQKLRADRGMRKIILLFLCLSTYIAKGQESLDSISYKQKLYIFCPKQLILPLSLTAVGGIGICNPLFNSLNNKVKDGMDDWRGNHRLPIDDYIQYLPVVSHLGLPLLGAKNKYSFQDRIIVTATSYITMAILVNSIKLTVDRSFGMACS